MYARLCRLMNRDYPDIVRSLICAKRVEGGFVCYEKGDEETPLCDISSSEKEAIKNALKEVTVRRLIANKCQDGLRTEGEIMKLENRRHELEELLEQPHLKKKETDVSTYRTELAELELQINILRCRILGNVQFIGELFNCGLLRNESVIKSVFDYLITPVSNADNDKTEILCKLLSSVGKIMHNDVKYSNLLDSMMCQIEGLKDSPTLTWRIRFCVMELIDLANNMWESDQKEKLEKLSDMRMKKTIEKLESIIE